MELISIGSATHIDGIRTRLYGEIEALRRQGCPVDITEEKRGGLTFLQVRTPGAPWESPLDTDSEVRFKAHVADALADLIVGDLKTRMLGDIISTRHRYLTDDERFKVLQQAVLAPGSLEERRRRISQRLLDYLGNHHELVVEGFVRFRLKDFCKDLRALIERSVDSFLVEREYREFIKLLRYFVEIQDPKVEEAHVVQSVDGNFRLIDGASQPIRNEYLDSAQPVVANEGEVDQDDLLLSALVSVSPRKVVIHLPRDLKVVETIMGVFEERASLCAGCQVCGRGAAAVPSPGATLPAGHAGQAGQGGQGGVDAVHPTGI